MNVSVVGAQIRGRMSLAAHVELDSSSANERDVIHSLKQHVSSSLPGYMHPIFWKIWPSLPKNPNGKTNVKILIRETEALFLKDNMKVEGDRLDTDSINHPLLLAISSMWIFSRDVFLFRNLSWSLVVLQWMQLGSP